MSTLPDERPTSACVLCPAPDDDHDWKQADEGYLTCSACLDRLRECLRDIVERYSRLDAAPGAQAGDGTRGSPGFGSKPPLSLHVVTMTDPRSKSYEVARDGVVYVWDANADHGRRLPDGVHGPEEPPGAFTAKREVWFGSDGRPHSESERPARSIPGALSSLAQMVAEERDMTPPRGTVEQLCRWLDQQMDYVTRHDWVADVSQELRGLLAQLRPVTGDPRIRIGACPNTIDEGDVTRECSAPLYAPTGNAKSDTIRCGGCGRRWHRPEWEYLGQLIQGRRAS